jgi:hypothetical protein
MQKEDALNITAPDWEGPYWSDLASCEGQVTDITDKRHRPLNTAHGEAPTPCVETSLLSSKPSSTEAAQVVFLLTV